jgi:hypothetical protein
MAVAVIQSFKLRNYEINRTNIVDILPPDVSLGEEDGLFGFDFLKANASILPVGASYILCKPGNSPVPSIDPFMQSMGFKSVPLQYVAGGLRVVGRLNGQPFNALVDCGASYSCFDVDYIAKVQGGQILTGQMGMEGLDGNLQDAREFLPKGLMIGALSLDHTETLATKSPSFSHEGFNALFGYDLLAQHQAIIDLGHNMLWMK